MLPVQAFVRPPYPCVYLEDRIHKSSLGRDRMRGSVTPYGK
jgi:hypothetical protein